MKPTTFIFLIWLLLLGLRIIGIFKVNNWILIGVFALWFIVFYYRAHQENERMKKPMPVYLTNPYNEGY